MTRTGPSHPLCLAATATLLLNDFVLKSAWPGWVTGKLSDVAWLIVATVVVASLAVRLGVSERRARGGALIGVGALFSLLQLWPAVGETWVAIVGGAHVADTADLLALPALALVPLCWRPTPHRPLALPIAAFACVATSYVPCPSVRLPEDGTVDVDPNSHLLLSFGRQYVAHDTAGLRSAISLRPLDGGGEVDLITAGVGNQVLLCPRGGLQPDTVYRWEIEPFQSDSTNHVPPPWYNLEGVSFFTTGPTSELAPITSERQCRQRADASYACGEWDTGRPDSGDSADTDDSGDSGLQRRRW